MKRSEITLLVVFLSILLIEGFRSRMNDIVCPPYDQCTPRGAWNHPNCKCWQEK